MPSTVSISKKLSHELLNLDIDEVMLIESAKSRKKTKMYINKRTSRCYVLEICSDLTDKSEIKFYRNTKHIRKLIDNIYGKDYTVTIY